MKPRCQHLRRRCATAVSAAFCAATLLLQLGCPPAPTPPSNPHGRETDPQPDNNAQSLGKNYLWGLARLAGTAAGYGTGGSTGTGSATHVPTGKTTRSCNYTVNRPGTLSWDRTKTWDADITLTMVLDLSIVEEVFAERNVTMRCAIRARGSNNTEDLADFDCGRGDNSNSGRDERGNQLGPAAITYNNSTKLVHVRNLVATVPTWGQKRWTIDTSPRDGLNGVALDIEAWSKTGNGNNFPADYRRELTGWLRRN
jgi:hypothetical protein